MIVVIALLIIILWCCTLVRVVAKQRDKALDERDHYISQMQYWHRKHDNLLMERRQETIDLRDREMQR